MGTDKPRVNILRMRLILLTIVFATIFADLSEAYRSHYSRSGGHYPRVGRAEVKKDGDAKKAEEAPKEAAEGGAPADGKEAKAAKAESETPAKDGAAESEAPAEGGAESEKPAEGGAESEGSAVSPKFQKAFEELLGDVLKALTEGKTVEPAVYQKWGKSLMEVVKTGKEGLGGGGEESEAPAEEEKKAEGAAESEAKEAKPAAEGAEKETPAAEGEAKKAAAKKKKKMKKLRRMRRF